MLTGNDLLSTKFTATKFRDGYSVTGVDDFLDKVIGTLRALESGQAAGPRGAALMTPDEVLNHRFVPTRFREGYEIAEVDDLLDRIVETLKTYIQQAHGGATQSQDSSHSGGQASMTGFSPDGGHWNADSANVDHAAPGPAVSDGFTDTATATATATAPSPSIAAGSTAGVGQSGDTMAAQDFLRDLQYQRALMTGSARESLRFRGSDGREFAPVWIERAPDGLIVHIA